jgi:hypothetical protein
LVVLGFLSSFLLLFFSRSRSMNMTFAIFFVICFFKRSDDMFAAKPFVFRSEPPRGEGENGDRSEDHRSL